MHPTILLFILLFIPNTSLTDWQNADAPNLHELIADGSIGLMNARTAETDKITTQAGEATIFAGERVFAPTESTIAKNPALYGNLEDALVNNGFDVSGDLPVAIPTLPFYTPTSSKQFVCKTLSGSWSDIDNQIGQAAETIRKYHGVLMIVSPNPSIEDYNQEKQLTPALLVGPGIPPGTLVSSSTRVQGLITNTDIAPTIAQIAGTKLPLPAFGAVINVHSAPDDEVSQLLNQEAIWVTQAKTIKIVPFIAAFISLLVLAAIAFGNENITGTRTAAAFAATLPLVMLLSWTLPILAGLALLALVISAVVLRPQDTSFFIAVTTIIMVGIDLVAFSGHLTAISILGYSPIEGARYYGIGNEIMGAYIGALAVITMLFDSPNKSRYGLYLLWVLAGLSLSLPTTGSKAGGLIVCAITLAAYICRSMGKSLVDVRTISAMFIAFCAAIGLLVFLSRFGPTTHVGDTLAMAKAGGFHEIIDTIVRKAGMDMHLVFHSIWIWVLLLTSYSRIKLRKSSTAASVGTVATLACLLFNDTGVVAAAICGLIIWAAEFNGVSEAESVVPAIRIAAAKV